MTDHFLTVAALRPTQLTALLDDADRLKAQRGRSDELAGLSVGVLFERPSTRTRVSFEVGIAELGATPVVMDAGHMQLGRGETIEDTARVLSRYLHALVVRTGAHTRLELLAEHGTIPVVNALSDTDHPCQALADLQTIRAHTGGLAGRKVAYLGDGNNVAVSLLEAAALAGMHVVVGAPADYAPPSHRVAQAQATAQDTGGQVTVTDDPLEAAADADVLYTDVWTSMGHDAEREARLVALEPFQVNAELVAVADPGAIVMHCLPAHRGEEISAAVLDGPRSVVWDQAENRLHTQKALLRALLGDVARNGRERAT